MKKLDLITIICLAGLCWSVLMMGHEILGHGGAVQLLGGIPISVDAMYLNYSFPDATVWQDKIVRASGSLVNILFAIIAIIWISKLRQPGSWKGYFLWLVIMMNSFQAGSYIAFGRFIHSGMDWAMFLNGLEPLWLWKTLELLLGLTMIVTGFYFGRKYQYLFLDSESSIAKQKLKIFVVPLLTVTILSVLASLLMPTDNRIMMISGGVGNSFLFLFGMLILALIPTSKEKIKNILPLNRNPFLLIISLLVIGFYLFVMSPGISF